MHGTARHGTAGGAAPSSVPHRTAPGGDAPRSAPHGPGDPHPDRSRSAQPRGLSAPGPRGAGVALGARGRTPPPRLVAGSPGGARCVQAPSCSPRRILLFRPHGGERTGAPLRAPAAASKRYSRSSGSPPGSPLPGARCPEPRGCRGQRAVPGRPVQAASRWRRPLPPGCPGVPRWAPMVRVRVPPTSGNGSGEIPTLRAECNGFSGGACPRRNPPGTGPARGVPGTTCTTGPGGARGTAGLRPLQLWAGGWRVKTGPWGSPGLPREVADGGGSGCSPQPGPAPRSLQLDGCCSSLELK